jgi:hypothetical protein
MVSMPQAWQIARSAQRIKLALYYAAAALLLAWLALSNWLGRDVALWLLWPATSLALVGLCYGGFGARGFQMDRRGRMHWTSRWLLGPYRAGAWLNARLWTRGFPLAAEIQPGLFLGRLPSQAEWLAAGKPAIVSLSAELQNVDTRHGRCAAVLDLTEPGVATLQRAALFDPRPVGKAGKRYGSAARWVLPEVRARWPTAWPYRAHSPRWSTPCKPLRQARPQVVVGQAPYAARSMDERDQAASLVLGAWLRSMHTQGAIFAGILLVASMAALALGASAPDAIQGGDPFAGNVPLLLWPMVLFALQFFVLMPAERVLCLRLQFDARLFAALGQGQISLTDIDQGLARIGLRPAQTTTRSLSSRIAGSQKLIRLYAWVLAGQLVLAVGTCLLSGYVVFCFSGTLP